MWGPGAHETPWGTLNISQIIIIFFLKNMMEQLGRMVSLDPKWHEIVENTLSTFFNKIFKIYVYSWFFQELFS